MIDYSDTFPSSDRIKKAIEKSLKRDKTIEMKKAKIEHDALVEEVIDDELQKEIK